MLDNYLRRGETIESRLDELMTDGRASAQPAMKELRFREAQVLATLYGAGGNAHGTIINNMATAEASALYDADDVAQALDAAFEGGQAPTALKGAVLAILATGEPHDLLGGLVVSDSSLVPDDADGKSHMVEGDGRPTVDRSGVDFEATIPEHDADEELADRLADDEDFPEFVTVEATATGDPIRTEPAKPKKKGGKKTAAQRAAEEAGL